MRVKNIKWYPFKQGLKDYIYFKLEGHPTFIIFGIVNFAHAIQYIKRHILGKNEGTCKKRREDCKSDNKCLSNAKELNHKKYQLSQTVPVDITESYTRVGDEMFIPLEVSTFFLMNKDKKMNFQFVEGTVTITPDTAPIAEVISQSQVKQEEQEPDDVYDAVEVEGNSPVKVGGKMPRKYMPYTIRKLPNRRLYTVKGPGRTFAKGTTLEKAKKQVRLLYSIDRRNAKGTRRQK